MQNYDVLIVGAGHAGAQAAISLRQNGFAGTLAIVGDEPELPYERPPLSKEYLAGDKPFERLLIRPAAFWADRQVDMLLGRCVTTVGAAEKRIETAQGALGYGALIWAAGGSPRTLTCAGGGLPGVHAVRTRADVDAMQAEVRPGVRAVVIGGGYIGLEAAAVLTKLGAQVTVLEALGRVLARVAPEPLSRFYEAEHRAHGVDLLLGVSVECIEGDGRARAVRLADGNVLPADLVVVGIGIAPAVEPLLRAGAGGDNGVRVDAQCRASLPEVFAVGDCALHCNDFADGAELRLESVQNANDMATVAAKTICGLEARYHAVPWFWSNQYDLRLQTIGLAIGFDEAVVRGDPGSRSFSVISLRNGRIAALDCVNATKDYVAGRALIGREAGVGLLGALVDPAVPLKSLA